MDFSYPVPSNEPARLRALRDYAILDTPPSPQFDRLCQIAASSLDMPIALISIVDQGRQWFKARLGVDACETGRDQAFCAHAIMTDAPLVVEDAAVDPRFANNPLVTSGPGIRFYAGVPLVVDAGIRLGTICVIDTRPRRLDSAQLALLSDLAMLAVAAFRAEALERRLKRALSRRSDHAGRLRDFIKRSALASQLSSVGWWEYDFAAGTTMWSKEVYRIHDIDRSYPLTAQAALDFYADDVRAEVWAIHSEAIANGRAMDYVHPIVTAAGRHRWVRVIGQPTFAGGAVVRFSGAVQDITEQEEAKARVHFLAFHDALTGLANRALFNKVLAETIQASARTRTSAALILVDLDYLKAVNDSLGHDAGDAAIREVALRLAACTRSTDMVARLGGDEFAIVLPGAGSKAAALRIVAAMERAFERPWVYGGAEHRISVSTGIALFPSRKAADPDPYKMADMALYQAKSQGRGGHCFYGPELKVAADAGHAVILDARGGLSRNQFEPYYQPLVALDGGVVTGFEALLRWRHPERGLLTPADFGAALDDPGMAQAFGDVTISAVIERMRHWTAAGVVFGHVAINVNAALFRWEGAADQLLERMAVAGLHPSMLRVEVTENVVLGRDSERIAAILGKLHEAGVSIALDDFGTGYASLVHLTQFPADVLKIDRSFVAGLPDTAASAQIVRAIISLAHGLGKRVVAEGVETRAQADALAALDCDEAQGFLFAPALRADDVPRFVSAFGRRIRRLEAVTSARGAG